MSHYSIVEKPSMIVVGIECRTSNAPDAGPKDIPQLWERFYGEDCFSKISNKASNEVIGLYCDYEGDYTKPYRLVIGCQVNSADDLPTGVVKKVVPASSFAVFKAIGEHPKALMETWGKIWQTNLKRTYSGDYEVYGDKFLSGFPQEVEVRIAVHS